MLSEWNSKGLVWAGAQQDYTCSPAMLLHQGGAVHVQVQ